MSTSVSSRANGDYNKDKQEEVLDLHELAKGWKAAAARASDPATRFVFSLLYFSCIIIESRFFNLE